jgi:tRNA(fMet)-specific endonuclease VapC
MIYMLDTNILIYLIKNKPPGIATRINFLDNTTLRYAFHFSRMLNC